MSWRQNDDMWNRFETAPERYRRQTSCSWHIANRIDIDRRLAKNVTFWCVNWCRDFTAIFVIFANVCRDFCHFTVIFYCPYRFVFDFKFHSRAPAQPYVKQLPYESERGLVFTGFLRERLLKTGSDDKFVLWFLQFTILMFVVRFLDEFFAPHNWQPERVQLATLSTCRTNLSPGTG